MFNSLVGVIIGLGIMWGVMMWQSQDAGIVKTIIELAAAIGTLFAAFYAAKSAKHAEESIKLQKKQPLLWLFYSVHSGRYYLQNIGSGIAKGIITYQNHLHLTKNGNQGGGVPTIMFPFQEDLSDSLADRFAPLSPSKEKVFILGEKSERSPEIEYLRIQYEDLEGLTFRRVFKVDLRTQKIDLAGWNA